MDTAIWDAKSEFEKYKNKEIFDCMLAEFLLSNGKTIASLEKTLEKYKVATIDELATKQKTLLQNLPKIQTLLTDIELPLIKVLWNMEKNGITLDINSLKKVGEEIESEILKIEKTLRKEMGEGLNLNSSLQIGNFLSEITKVPLKKTKTGRFATSESEISQHAEAFPIIKTLLKYRELSKLRSTYVESLISKIDKTGRIHTTYHQAAVNTGRLASTNPNLQNIPVNSVFGQKIKSCFIASPDKILISFDYSQQELRILAHLTGEDELIKAFKENKDVHKITASKIFNVEYADISKAQRMVGKTINFGIIYGMSSYGLSMSLKISNAEAQKFIDTFYTTYPKIRTFYDNYFKESIKNDFVETILGRRRYVFEYPSQKFINNNMRRVLLNYPIQGSAADLIKKAMVEIQKEILDSDPEILLLLQIHDDLVFEVKDPSASSGQADKFKEFITKVRKIMCNVYPLDVPIEVDVKIGKKWGDLLALSNNTKSELEKI